jgi:nitrile hydratase accessory protein
MTDAATVPANLAAAEALLRDTDAPAFGEPWMAQAFACAIQLSRHGLFTWSEWVEVFSTEIKAHPAQPGETSNAAYYRQWLAALETIVGIKGAASTAEITERQETWRRALSQHATRPASRTTPRRDGASGQPDFRAELGGIVNIEGLIEF